MRTSSCVSLVSDRTTDGTQRRGRHSATAEDRYQKYTDGVVEKDRAKTSDRFTDVYTELLEKAEELSLVRQVPIQQPQRL